MNCNNFNYTQCELRMYLKLWLTKIWEGESGSFDKKIHESKTFRVKGHSKNPEFRKNYIPVGT